MAKRRRRKSKKSDAAKAAEAFSGLNPQSKFIVVALIALIGLVALYLRRHTPPTSNTTTPPPTAQVPPAAGSDLSRGPVNMLLGNPSDATPDPANRSNYLMVKPYFSLAYDDAAGTPRWVSWRVTPADLEGSTPRKQLFDTDETLPPGFHPVTHKDYTGSGFDRGHMCPHADRDASKEMSYSTFVMTNIIPQAPHLNQGPWADLEDDCRDVVRQDRARLYITAGPLGQGGRGSTGGTRRTIADGQVRVPAACWKVIVVVPPAPARSADDLANITPDTRVIAVLMPNDNASIGHDWSKYRTTPAEIERQTGLHFFDRLPPDVAGALRQKSDTLPAGARR